MKIPAIRGVIDRRILVNYRVDPSVLAGFLPEPFRPKLVNGKGRAGVCLIRPKDFRPKFLPPFLGLSTENAAHTIAFEWDRGGERLEGVYVPRRDTSSRINAAAGGRLFPGEHHHATFRVQERDDRYRIALDGDDREAHLLVEGQLAKGQPEGSIFGSVAEASAFFERGLLGYSATARARAGEFDAPELRCFGWRVEPLAIGRVECSFFEDRTRFPVGSSAFDRALLMRGIEQEWPGREALHAA